MPFRLAYSTVVEAHGFAPPQATVTIPATGFVTVLPVAAGAT